VPGTGGRIYFANENIQYPNCTGSAFTLTIGTCGGTRDGNANWGTSVNYVVSQTCADRCRLTNRS
jgi:hypothetical protein